MKAYYESKLQVVHLQLFILEHDHTSFTRKLLQVPTHLLPENPEHQPFGGSMLCTTHAVLPLMTVILVERNPPADRVHHLWASTPLRKILCSLR